MSRNLIRVTRIRSRKRRKECRISCRFLSFCSFTHHSIIFKVHWYYTINGDLIFSAVIYMVFICDFTIFSITNVGSTKLNYFTHQKSAIPFSAFKLCWSSLLYDKGFGAFISPYIIIHCIVILWMYEKKINLNWILDFIPNICTYMYISKNNKVALNIDVGHFDMDKW